MESPLPRDPFTPRNGDSLSELVVFDDEPSNPSDHGGTTSYLDDENSEYSSSIRAYEQSRNHEIEVGKGTEWESELSEYASRIAGIVVDEWGIQISEFDDVDVPPALPSCEGGYKHYEPEEEDRTLCGVPVNRRCCVLVAILMTLAVIGSVTIMTGGDNIETETTQPKAEPEEGGGAAVDDTGTEELPPFLDGPTPTPPQTEAGIPSLIPPATQKPSSQPSVSPRPSEVLLPPTEKPTEKPTPEPTPSPVSSKATSTPTSKPYESFSFYVMGDVPYNVEEVETLKLQLDEIKHHQQEQPADFLVHLGNFGYTQGTHCDPGYYSFTRDLLLTSPIPALVLPGENDWYKCPDPNMAWSEYANNFIGLEEEWKNHRLPIGRMPARPENFVMFHHNVLFLSVNLLWDELMDNNIAWTSSNVNGHFTSNDDVRAVVIFGHPKHNAENHKFFEWIAGLFLDEWGSGESRGMYFFKRDVPVLYLHANGQGWEVDRRFAEQTGWDQFFEVQVDRGGMAPPLRVEVLGSDEKKEKVDLGEPMIDEEDGLFMLIEEWVLIDIDRRGGPYLSGMYENRTET